MSTKTSKRIRKQARASLQTPSTAHCQICQTRVACWHWQPISSLREVAVSELNFSLIRPSSTMYSPPPTRGPSIAVCGQCRRFLIHGRITEFTWQGERYLIRNNHATPARERTAEQLTMWPTA